MLGKLAESKGDSRKIAIFSIDKKNKRIMSDKPTVNVKGFPTLGTILFIVFLILKLTGKIDWSWFWVIFPLWAGWVVLILLFVLIVIVGACASGR